MSAAPRAAPHISLIVAHDRRGVIGRDGGLPWRLPSDLKRFRRLTMGKTIVMGRRTWESLSGPLPGRRNVVLSRDPAFAPQGGEAARSAADALARADGDECMIIGGGEVFKLFLPRAGTVYRTLVETETPGDTRFPELPESAWLTLIDERLPPEPGDDCAVRFSVLKRVADD